MPESPRRISILGATGSIGVQALDLVARGGWEVAALTGGRNVDLLAAQARAHRPALTVTAFGDALPALRTALAGSGLRVEGPDALLEAAALPDGIVLNGIVGVAGLAPSLAAVRAGGTLALANKESLVAAGELLMAEAAAHGATVLPVDSEHSAVFQALLGEDPAAIERVIITASGGAFRDWPVDRLAEATVADASTHPNWSMGQRITIDSASMFNKALELIETREFFGVSPEQIEVLVHPQSLVHALVGFRDGAIMAHLGPHDMRHAIGFALNWPERAALPVERLDLARIGTLDFRAPDEARWPALRLAREVMAARGHAGAAFNAAKEAALDAFMAERIAFPRMASLAGEVLDWAAGQPGFNDPVSDLDGALAMDHLCRVRARALVGGRA